LARPGAFKSEKRKKELMRQKKQEKKRQRRLGKDGGKDTRDVNRSPEKKGQLKSR
jgi:hypothetical protein